MRGLTICVLAVAAATSAAAQDASPTLAEQNYALEFDGLGLGETSQPQAWTWTSLGGHGRTLEFSVGDLTVERTAFPTPQEVEAFVHPYTLRCEETPFFLEQRGAQVVLLRGTRLIDSEVLAALREHAWRTLPFETTPTRTVADPRVGPLKRAAPSAGDPSATEEEEAAADGQSPGAAGVIDSATSDTIETLAPEAPPFPGAELAAQGRRILLGKTWAHRNAIKKTGVGRYYGSKSIYAGLDDAAREAWIEEHKTGKVRRKPSKSSCVGWALNNLRAAYTKVGERERWTKHQAVIAANKSRGTDIATELLKDGWVAIYFNPDVRKPADGSNEHPLTARIALRSGTYYGIPVTHRVVNYRPSPGSGTARSIAGMRKLAKVPYWFGISRGGTHTFMGSRGNVNEFHWRSGPADPNAIEVTPLARFDWLSGLIVVPPGTWPE